MRKGYQFILLKEGEIMKKLCFLVIVLTITAMVFAGGGRQSGTQTGGTAGPYRADPNLNAPGVLPICKETVTLTVAVPTTIHVIDYKNTYLTKELERQGNFNLVFEVFPEAEYLQQLNLMAAAGGNDLPDVIMAYYQSFSDSFVYQLGLAGVIIPLDDYLKNSAYFINEGKVRCGLDMIPMVTSPNGILYTIPQYVQTLPDEYPNKLWIYQPWLQKLGLKVPETPDELYQVLKAFKERDPNGNGRADEIPLIDYRDHWNDGAIKALISPFQSVPSTHWFTVENGKVGTAYNTPGFREAMRYIHTLVSENLMPPVSFTQDRAQMVTMFSPDPVTIGMFVDRAMTHLPANDVRFEEYVGIPPLKGADGVLRTPYSPVVATAGMLISKNCRNPEAAFRLGDLMCNEEFTVMNRWGQKGVDWLVPGPEDVVLYPDFAPYLKFVANWGTPQNSYWGSTGPFIRQYSISQGVTFAGTVRSTAYQAAKAQAFYTGNRPKEYIAKLAFSPEEDRTVTEIMQNLDSFVKESIARFAVGELNVDRDWDGYISNLNTLGYNTMLPVVQRVYDRSK